MVFYKMRKNKKGFTLIELLIAMAIFVLFITVLINTYTFIVKAQRETNERRVIYVEARKVFDALTVELRDGMVDYLGEDADIIGCNEAWLASSFGDEICVVSKDNQRKSYIYYNAAEEQIELQSQTFSLASGAWDADQNPDQPVVLHSSDVRVRDLKFYIYPGIDPYNFENYLYDNAQFQPMVTVYAEFYMPKYEDEILELQTTISSRIYNQVYESTAP